MSDEDSNDLFVPPNKIPPPKTLDKGLVTTPKTLRKNTPKRNCGSACRGSIRKPTTLTTLTTAATPGTTDAEEDDVILDEGEEGYLDDNNDNNNDLGDFTKLINPPPEG